MNPYAELLEFNQPNPIRKKGFTRIRDGFDGLIDPKPLQDGRWFYDPERIMEFAGRWDYGQNNARKLGEMSKGHERGCPTPVDATIRCECSGQVPIIQKYIGMGHESMIEMGDATFFIECSRVVSHELVRHRIASYQQESQRFVKYEDEVDLFYVPDGAGKDNDTLRIYEEAVGYARGYYRALRKAGVSPQEARYVLPNAMRTRLIMKTNAREWRHIVKLRLDKSAQPEMQQLMQQIYDQLVDIFPNAMKGVLEGERGVR